MFSALIFPHNLLTKWIPKILKNPHSPSVLVGDAARKLSRKEYSDLVSLLRFGNVCKTTDDHRHSLTDEYICSNLLEYTSSILDVGASEGITSLNLIEKTPSSIDRYYVTDYNLYADFVKVDGWSYFFDVNSDNCVLVFNNMISIRPSRSKFLTSLFEEKIKAAREKQAEFERIMLINPSLLKQQENNTNIEIRQYNILDKWDGEKVQFVKVANVLNRVYFSDDQIREALDNVKQALVPNGVLCIIHNFGKEFASFYKLKDNKFILSHEINGGVLIKDLVE